MFNEPAEAILMLALLPMMILMAALMLPVAFVVVRAAVS